MKNQWQRRTTPATNKKDELNEIKSRSKSEKKKNEQAVIYMSSFVHIQLRVILRWGSLWAIAQPTPLIYMLCFLTSKSSLCAHRGLSFWLLRAFFFSLKKIRRVLWFHFVMIIMTAAHKIKSKVKIGRLRFIFTWRPMSVESFPHYIPFPSPGDVLIYLFGERVAQWLHAISLVCHRHNCIKLQMSLCLSISSWDALP